MKAIINGKRYNTETATKVADWSNDYCYSDFNYCHEELFVTNKGAFFLIGEGGALSLYSKPAFGGGTAGSSEVFQVLTGEETLTWLERHDLAEEAEKYFSDSIEDA